LHRFLFIFSHHNPVNGKHGRAENRRFHGEQVGGQVVRGHSAKHCLDQRGLCLFKAVSSNFVLMVNFHYSIQGKLKYKETITDGFQNIPKAFVEMMQGKNFGKAIIKA